jgi:hypothetical protein
MRPLGAPAGQAHIAVAAVTVVDADAGDRLLAVVLRTLMMAADEVAFAIAVACFGKIGEWKDQGHGHDQHFRRIRHDDWTHIVLPSG